MKGLRKTLGAEKANSQQVFEMFKASCRDKPGAWFWIMSADGQLTLRAMYQAGWWLCISESEMDGIIASFGTDPLRGRALGRTPTVDDAKAALADLIEASDEAAEAIRASASFKQARKLMREVIELNLSERFGTR